MYCIYVEQILWLASNDEIKIVVSSLSSTNTKNHILPQKRSFVCSGSFNILESLNKKCLTIQR